MTAPAAGDGQARSPAALQRTALRNRALRLLAQREHGRQELRGKLLRAALRPPPPDRRRAVDGLESLASVDVDALERDADAVLDALEAAGLLSDARAAASRLHQRMPRLGNARILNELAQKGLQATEAQRADLASSELARAHAVWLRRHGQLSADAAERARQQRFLAQRGFSGQSIQRLFRGLADGTLAQRDQPADDATD